MQPPPSLTKKQARNFNRRFELGVYRKKLLQDYPLLLTYLANVLEEAHEQALQGKFVKLTMGEGLILDEPHAQCNVSSEFWSEKLGHYIIESCHASTYDVLLSVRSPDRKDFFYPDDYVLLTAPAQCQIDVTNKGTISGIYLVLNTKPPSFIRELARDFSLGGRCARRALRQRIKSNGEEPDKTFLAPIKFGRATVIAV